MANRILIVDDEAVQRRLLEAIVTRLGYECETVSGGEAALAALGRREGPRFDAVVLDLVMPDLDGMGVLQRLPADAPPVVVQTANGGVETAVSAMRAGAFDFIVKPASPERIRVSLANALRLGALAGEIVRLKRAHDGTLTFRDIVTRSPAMDRVLDLGRRAARSSIPVLIEGESGVGKELVARAIQGSSVRRSRPFVTVNCGAIPETLVESVLFGHEKGAFTGAENRHAGKFREAHGGTLFLDEVGDLPPGAQVKLLRALADGEIDPIGAVKPLRVDFRLIAATNRRLIDLVAEGRFREDLYYRLNVFPIWVPPLRERREDVPELARRFLARFSAEEGKKRLTRLSAEALDLLCAHDWPGNVRQLENAIFRAVVLCDGDEITPHDLPHVAAQVGARPAPPPQSAPPPALTIAPARRDDGAAIPSGVSIADNAASSRYGLTQLLDERGELRPFDAIEEQVIRFALEHCRGRMSEVARRLGIGRSTLYRKLKDYGIGAEDASAA